MKAGRIPCPADRTVPVAIYSWNYGVELEKLFGEGITPYLQARIRNAIEDALLADDRITQVDGFSFERTAVSG